MRAAIPLLLLAACHLPSLPTDVPRLQGRVVPSVVPLGTPTEVVASVSAPLFRAGAVQETAVLLQGQGMLISAGVGVPPEQQALTDLAVVDDWTVRMRLDLRAPLAPGELVLEVTGLLPDAPIVDAVFLPLEVR